MPLRTRGRAIGAIHLSIPEAVPPHPVELEFLDVLADTCAQALERIEAAAVAEKQTSRLAFLAEASIQLASSLDLRATTAKVTRMTVPRFADWCAIDVLRGGTLRRLAAAHTEPEKAELVTALQERWPEGPTGGSLVGRVARTGRPLLSTEVTDTLLDEAARDDEHRAALAALEIRSVLAVPLLVRGSRLRACSPGPRATRAVATTRTTCASPSTSPGARRARSTTPTSTARPVRWPSSCSAPCCPASSSGTPTGRSPGATSPPAAPRSAATSTTPSRSAAGGTWPSSAT